ncbi:MAG: alpha-galactosidase [Erysipelothrix sp.]|nr:alpha-galactosidase [Erysipelothrix sp.]
MIQYKDSVFHLKTKETSYIFRVDDSLKLNQLYYGNRLEEESLDALSLHQVIQVGSSVLYDGQSMDLKCLELSEPQVGDYRNLSTDIWVNNQQACDFKYVGYEMDVVRESVLPRGRGRDSRLVVYLMDEKTGVRIGLVYDVFYEANVISRYVLVENVGEESLLIENIVVNFDCINDDFELISFHGGWIKEAHEYVSDLGIGRTVIASTTTSSSNQHQPGFFLRSKVSDSVYGFNLMYSGNHKSVIERTSNEFVRVVSGINDEQFNWTLKSGEVFESPSVVMTYGVGINNASSNFHDFVNKHVVSKVWANKERPITYNHWEATFFDYNEKKLLKMAKVVSDLGCELFVLDDGWFVERNNDLAGLGNYEVDKKKFPKGLLSFRNKIVDMGLKFGLWVEPEMVSIESSLYRKHPEYALGVRDKRFGRNQLVLDLTNKDVRDYIVSNVRTLIEEYKVDYIKWDMNRHISDQESIVNNYGKEFSHRYILGLYEVLERIFGDNEVLLESCSSGGNRFDLGMLSYGPQVWTSDNTDPIERLKIQGGISRLYPLSTISAHVASELSQQTLRKTPLSTRFNVACFGVLGYELDLTYLSAVEKKEIKDQISWYKKYRKVFQYGKFIQNGLQWQVSYEGVTIVGIYQTLVIASPPPHQRLRVFGLDKNKYYEVRAKAQRVMLDRYKELSKHILPVNLNPEGKIMKFTTEHFSLYDQQQNLVASGQLLESGIWLNNQYLGTGYHKELRLWSDFGSTLYVITERK